MQSMVRIAPFLATNGMVRHLRISLPLVPCLLDGQKYFSPGALPPPAGDELRPLFRPRLTPPSAHRAAALVDEEKHMMEPQAGPRPQGRELRRPRAPSLRYLVRLALRCQSAEEMGRKLKRRFDRQQRRTAAHGRSAECEMADQLDRLLAQD
jgi:hypothetical protein